MRKQSRFLTVALTLMAMVISFQVSAQKRDIKYVVTGKENFKLNTERDFRDGGINRSTNDISKVKKASGYSKEITDTLNFPLEGEYSIYFSGEGHYVSGNNEFGDQAKVNYFEIETGLMLSGILLDFAVATGGGSDVEIAVWDNTGSGNSPGTKLASELVSLDAIVNDVANEQMTFVAFDPPVEISTSFFAGAYLPMQAGDTLALWTNTDGDTDPATAWELWSDNNWYAYDDPASWGLTLSHAVFPIVTYPFDLLVDFEASETNIAAGNSVEFQDLTFGNPVSWMWEFPGGTPAQSTDQNPTVTYDETGVFDVKLVVTDGEVTDSLTKPGYISVNGGMPATDTLLYPLPGDYVVFIDNQNGGYICGTNSYGDLAKANYFDVSVPGEINEIGIEFYKATGGNPDIEVAIWSEGANNKPGTKLASAVVSLDQIKEDITNGQLTFVELDEALLVSAPFFAGFMLPTAQGDTLVVWSNDHQDTNPGIAWELWSDMEWFPFNQEPSWLIDCAMAIHPVINYSIGVDEITALQRVDVFPNPSDGVFAVSRSSIGDSPVSVEVYNSEGKSIENTIVSEGNAAIRIDLSGYPSGLYYLLIKDESNSYYSRLIKK